MTGLRSVYELPGLTHACSSLPGTLAQPPAVRRNHAAFGLWWKCHELPPVLHILAG